MDLPPGAFAVVNGLMSARGRRLNGKYGLVRGAGNDADRLSVEILGVDRINSFATEEAGPPVSIRKANLEAGNTSVGRRILSEYLKQQGRRLQKAIDPAWVTGRSKPWRGAAGCVAHHAERKRKLLQVLTERFAIPGVVPDMRDKWTLAVTLSMLHRLPDAVEKFRECIGESASAPADRAWMSMGLASCLMCQMRHGDAVSVLEGIRVPGGAEEAHTKKTLCEFLEQVDTAFWNIFRMTQLDLRERGLRKRLTIDPEDGKTMHNLGAIMMHKQRVAEGVFFYSRALERGRWVSGERYNAPNLREDLAMARQQLAMGNEMMMVPMSSGGMYPVFYQPRFPGDTGWAHFL